MRITGGALRGRTVECPPGTIRPAMDRMRESMFALLGDLTGVSFLDLFSGSGLVGLEAYSRGARPVVLVEKDRGKRHVILENIAGLDEAPTLVVEPVERYIARNRTAFSIVYLDPPFDYRFKSDLMSRVSRSRSIGPGSRVLIHAPKRERLSEEYGALRVDTRKEYGGSHLWVFGPDTVRAT
jgi:16S rRNA (guanine(966)-N(2))-methyltransferase RsmD